MAVEWWGLGANCSESPPFSRCLCLGLGPRCEGDVLDRDLARAGLVPALRGQHGDRALHDGASARRRVGLAHAMRVADPDGGQRVGLRASLRDTSVPGGRRSGASRNGRRVPAVAVGGPLDLRLLWWWSCPPARISIMSESRGCPPRLMVARTVLPPGVAGCICVSAWSAARWAAVMTLPIGMPVRTRRKPVIP